MIDASGSSVPIHTGELVAPRCDRTWYRMRVRILEPGFSGRHAVYRTPLLPLLDQPPPRRNICTAPGFSTSTPCECSPRRSTISMSPSAAAPAAACSLTAFSIRRTHQHRQHHLNTTATACSDASQRLPAHSSFTVTHSSPTRGTAALLVAARSSHRSQSCTGIKSPHRQALITATVQQLTLQSGPQRSRCERRIRQCRPCRTRSKPWAGLQHRSEHACTSASRMLLHKPQSQSQSRDRQRQSQSTPSEPQSQSRSHSRQHQSQSKPSKPQSQSRSRSRQRQSQSKPSKPQYQSQSRDRQRQSQSKSAAHQSAAHCRAQCLTARSTKCGSVACSSAAHAYMCRDSAALTQLGSVVDVLNRCLRAP